MPSRGPAHAPVGAAIELTVRLGQSPLPRVAYQPGLPPTRSTVGSGANVEWPLSAPGVEPRHAEFAWDGESLWVRDAGSQRGTFVNGVRIAADWVQVQPGHEVRLGQASIVASGAAQLSAQHAVQAVESTPFDDDLPTQMVSDDVVPHAPLPKAPSTSMGPGDSGIAERTVIVQSPYDASGNVPRMGGPIQNLNVTDPRGAPPASSVPLPRFGKTLPPSAGLRPPAPPTPESDGGEATVAFNVPEDRPPAPMPMLNQPPPGFQGPSPTPFAPMMSHGPMPGGPPGMMQGGFGQMPQQPPVTMPPSIPAGFAGGGGESNAPSIFGAIPPPPPPAAPAPKPVFTLPKRTLYLLGATMLAAVGVLALNPKHGPPARPTGASSVVAIPPPPAVPRAPLTPPVPGPPAGPTGVLMAATTAPPPPPPAPPDPHGRRPAEPPPPPVDTPERIAANTVAQSRFREAIPLYDQLAIAHPETPVYGQIAQILRRKVEALSQNCVPGSTTQCAPTTAAQP